MPRGFDIRRLRPQKVAATLTYPYIRLRLAILAFTSLVIIGTSGYHGIERWSVLDSLFMTVITLSGVGFGEVHDLDAAGKIFTIGLIIIGVGVAAWAVVTVVEVFTSEQGIRDLERRRMKRMIGIMKDHYIVCGYGRIGQEIIKGYIRNDVPFVVVDRDPAKLELVRSDGVPYVEGDATNDADLERAGLRRAKGLIAVTPTDAVNTFIVLSARGMRSDLMIVAPADSAAAVPKLYRAGANKVVSPHTLGGWWMAATAVNPAATDFMEGLSLSDHKKTALFEFVVGRALHNKPIGSFDFKGKSGVLVVALRRGSDFTANPDDTFLLHFGDAIIALGSPAQFRRFAPLCNPDAPMKIELPFELVE